MVINSEKFNFQDFTHKHYIELLKKAKISYEFSAYNDKIISSNKNIILWRHDVDFSMHEALNLARIENELGVQSTFFILFHSEFYNIFEAEIAEKIKLIIDLGHHIGLHFDPVFYKISTKEELEDKLRFEKNILQDMFLVDINVFSFHNPTTEILLFDDWSYSGMINTYAKEIKEEISYCSDSNGYWRFSRMYDVIANERPLKLQALTHPEWWTEKVMSPKEKIWRCIDKRAEKNKNFYKNSLKFYDRSVIDWN